MEYVFENSRAKICALKTELERVDCYKRLYGICPIINCSGLKVFWVDYAQTGFTFIQSEPSKFSNSFKEFDKEIASKVAVMKFPVLIDSIPKYNTHHPNIADDPKATSTLVYPLLDSNKKTMAVIQFVKVDGSKFAPNDIEYLDELIKWLSFYTEQQSSAQKDKIGYDLNQFLSSKLLDFFNGAISFGQMIGRVVMCLRHFLENEHSFFYEISIGAANKIAKGLYVEATKNEKECGAFVKVKDFVLIKDGSLIAEVMGNFDFTEFVESADLTTRLDPNIFDHCAISNVKSCALVPICYAEYLFGIFVLINPLKLKNVYELELITNYMGQCLHYKYLQECLDYEKNRSCVIKECLLTAISNKNSYSSLKWDVQVDDNFDTMEWCIGTGDDNLMAYVYHMFSKMFSGILEDDNIRKFISSCLQTHRDEPYHNFKLTFRILRTVYCILWKIGQHLTTNEKMSLMITAVLIYCDHNAFDNEIMIRLNHPVAKIFPKYHKKEKKRIWLGKLILESSCLLKTLSKEDADKVVDCFNEIIHSNSNWSSPIYFEKVRNALIHPEYSFTLEQRKHRKFLLNLVFRCGLQARHVQEFNMVKELCEDLFKEYFDIGDMELESGYQPTPRKNRKNFNKIPEYELEYINKSVIPLFEILTTLFPNTAEFLKTVRKVAKAYEIVLDKEGKSLWSQDKSLGKSMSDRLHSA